MGQAERQDLHYGLDLMLDCMGELLYRVRELEAAKPKPKPKPKPKAKRATKKTKAKPRGAK